MLYNIKTSGLYCKTFWHNYATIGMTSVKMTSQNVLNVKNSEGKSVKTLTSTAIFLSDGPNSTQAIFMSSCRAPARAFTRAPFRIPASASPHTHNPTLAPHTSSTYPGTIPGAHLPLPLHPLSTHPTNASTCPRTYPGIRPGNAPLAPTPPPHHPTPAPEGNDRICGCTWIERIFG
jgi:hypothetical protein